MTFEVHNGDVITQLRALPSGSFDGCLCDPPYGLSSVEKRSMRRATPRASSRARAAGFMGMEWDALVPGPEVWLEVLRVLRPGAPLLAFGGPRTYHRLAVAIETAGFTISDTICWLYGQGYPKGRAQLKPSWEPITLAWKEGKRSLSIDAARIPAPDAAYRKNCSGDRGFAGTRERRIVFRMGGGSASDAGRWPANVILDEEAAGLLDRQSGVLKSGANPTRRRAPKTRNTFGAFPGQPECVAHRGATVGGASRFFYCAKASKAERGEANVHPTVKPITLTEYLATLILPEQGRRRLLVPYCGTGSEMIGALMAGWEDVVGIERESTFCDLARARIDHHVRATRAAAI